MKFSIRGLFAFEFKLTIPRFRVRPRPAGLADYKLDRFFVAGFQCHDGPKLVDELEPGMTLDLVPEPENPHDARAVTLHHGGFHVGYVPRARNRTISALLDQGAPLSARIVHFSPEADPWKVLQVAVTVLAGKALTAMKK